MVICLERGANDLHMVQLMPLPVCHPIISCSSKIQNGLPFWCRLTQFVLEKRPLNRCSSSREELINVGRLGELRITVRLGLAKLLLVGNDTYHGGMRLAQCPVLFSLCAVQSFLYEINTLHVCVIRQQ